jgi:ubiquinone biosynthesis UbiH/UbiF/VisC/COQ6 family hydroxylase
LVVAADSRFSKTREMMGIRTEQLNFDRTCIVTRMTHEEPHDETAYECFFESHTLAVLPLNNKRVSIVMTLDSSEADGVLSLSPVGFAKMISDKIGARLGKMKLDTKLFSYPLISTYAQKFYAPRYALLGDAAVGMHPVTAHGFNFGLRGADVLAREIQIAANTGIDIGSASVLRNYSAQHRMATRPMYFGTNTLVKLYTHRSKPAAWLRGALLRIGNNLPPAKRMIMNQLTETDAA